MSSDTMSKQDYLTAHDTHVRSTVPLRLVIESKTLIEELRDITKVSFHQHPLILVPAYKLLVHHWDTIQATLQKLKKLRDLDRVSESRDHEVGDIITRIDHLQCLHNFVQTDLAHLIGLRLKARDATLEYVHFDELYYLFSIGDLIVGSNTGQDQLYQVYAMGGGRMRLQKPQSPEHFRSDVRLGGSGENFTNLKLACFILAWDGKKIGPIHFVHEIQCFTGRRRVTDLAAYPLRVLENPSRIQIALRKRGYNVVESFGHMRYSAQSSRPLWPLQVFIEGTHRRFHNGSLLPWDQNSKRVASIEELEYVDGDVYIDYKERYRFDFEMDPLISELPRLVRGHLETTESIDGQNDSDVIDGGHSFDDFLTDQFMLQSQHIVGVQRPVEGDGARLQLLSPHVPGYDLRSRRWLWLDVRSVQSIDKSTEASHSAWNELVIPNDYKTVLLPLVHNHVLGTGPKIQIHPAIGKSRGLIVHLRGPSGTGKTFTAESIAAYTGRPLYSISCGEISRTPTEAQSSLEEARSLVELWGCILLIDEADSLVVRRSGDDLTRNALDSVFLRFLESYSGVLFLTTNVDYFINEAVKSRIHVSLQYRRINLESTLEIWKRLLQRIERENSLNEVEIKFGENELLTFAKKHYRACVGPDSTWNGRQIRNAFQTAIALARCDAMERGDKHISLKVENFKTIARNDLGFYNYDLNFATDEESGPEMLYRTSPYGEAYARATHAAREVELPKQANTSATRAI